MIYLKTNMMIIALAVSISFINFVVKEILVCKNPSHNSKGSL